MSLVFSPVVHADHYAPTRLCLALAQHAGSTFEVRPHTRQGRTLSLIGASLDIFFTDDGQSANPPVPSLYLNILGTPEAAQGEAAQDETPQVAGAPTPTDFYRIGIDSIPNPSPGVSAVVMATLACASELAEICHLESIRPLGTGWMRLFVFEHAMILACEYAGSLERDEIAQCCAPEADAEARSGLATVLLRDTPTHHQRLELAAHAPVLAQHLHAILMDAADGNHHMEDLTVHLAINQPQD